MERFLDRQRHPFARSLWFVLAATALGWLAPAPAAGHAELIGATPTPNATVAESPGEVTIAFSEPIDAGSAFVDILDSRLRRVEGVGSVEVAGDGRVAGVTLPALEPGTYTVSYQVVSAVDGHATVGQFAFLVDPTGASAPPIAPVTATSPSVDGMTVGARWVALAALLVAFGSLVGWWRARGARPDLEPPWRLIGLAALAGAGGVAAYLWLAARPIAEAVAPRGPLGWLDPAAPFGWSPFAIAMRVAMLAGLMAGAVALARRRPAAVAVLLAAALGGMSAAGHAASAGGVPFALLDWLHLVAVAAWLGALPALLLLGRQAGALSSLLRRHGGLALVAAPVVVLTGLANSPLVLGSGRDVVASDYGNLLLAKAVLLSVALGIGAVNHLALRGRGRAAVTALVATEVAVAALAVSAAATMVTIQPAAARPAIVTAPRTNPVHLFGDVAGARVHVTVGPPVPDASQSVQTLLTDLDSGFPVADASSVAVELTPPSPRDAQPRTIVLEPADEVTGLFGASGRLLPAQGDWTLMLGVTRASGARGSVAFVVPVASPAPAEPVPQRDTGIGVPAPLAAVWSVLPRGPVAWLPVILALVVLPLAWRLPPSAARTAARSGLVVLTVVAGIGAGSRVLVDAANAPPAAALESPPAEPASAASLALGEGIYLANCASCHGPNGDGDGPIRTSPPAGAIHDTIAALSPAELSYRIAYGVAGTGMPAFAGTLTRDERWALVAWLQSRWAEP